MANLIHTMIMVLITFSYVAHAQGQGYVNVNVPGESTITGDSKDFSCNEIWSCGLWSECENDKQSRNCIDKSGCSNSISKPKESRTCITLEEIKQRQERSRREVLLQQPEQPGKLTVIETFYINIILIYILSGILLLYLWHRHLNCKKEDNKKSKKRKRKGIKKRKK